MRSTISKLAFAAATAVFLNGTTAPALAQTEASTPAATQATASQPITKEQKKQAKAQRKVERKEARAKKNAELKKLEDAGYQPAQNGPSYPENLQDAQKKANAGASH